MNVVEADLEPEEVDGLGELIDRDRLRVVSVNVAERLPQVPESLIDLEGHEAEELDQAFFFLRLVMPADMIWVLLGQIAFRVRCHNVSHLVRVVLVEQLVDFHRGEVEAVDELCKLLNRNHLVCL